MNPGKLRVHSAGSSRAGCFAPSGDSAKMMRDTMLKLQQDVLQAKAETKKVNDQLNCLINLVKRAWTGNKTAAIHVANIVGVAPPDIDNQSSSEAPAGSSVKLKNRGLNNWALLTIGLLNREYRVEERQLEFEQRQFLQTRQDYLEEQLLQHRDMQAKLEYEAMTQILGRGSGKRMARPRSGRPSPLVKSSSHGDLTSAINSETTNGLVGGGFQRQVPRQGREAFLTQPPPSPQPQPDVKPPSGGGRKKSAGRPMYRPQSSKTREEHISVSDLFIDPSQAPKINKSTHQTMDGLYRLSSLPTQDHTPSEHIYHYDPDYMGYDDPRRYSNHGIFDIESAIGHDAVAKRQRPTSAIQQRKTDSLRSRPKSAVYTPGDRPLKFETTRPASAKSATKNTQPSSAKGRGKGVKPKKTIGGKSPEQEDDTHDSGDVVDKEQKVSEEEDELEESPVQFPRNTFNMKINIDKPQSVLEYEQEVNRMNDLEKDFKKTTMELQKKLGISKDGMIY